MYICILSLKIKCQTSNKTSYYFFKRMIIYTDDPFEMENGPYFNYSAGMVVNDVKCFINEQGPR